MPFECDTDRGLLGALKQQEDNVPIGEATFIVVEPDQEVLNKTFSILASCFARAGGRQVPMGLSEWIAGGMKELTGIIFH